MVSVHVYVPGRLAGSVVSGDQTRRASYSQISDYRQCPQRWKYRYLDRLDAAGAGGNVPARDLGSWWHAVRAADAIDRGRGHGSLVPALVPTHLSAPLGGREHQIPTAPDSVQSRVFTEAARAWRSLTEAQREEYAEAWGGSLPDRLTEIDRRWRDRWSEETATEHPVGVEIRWTRALPAVGGVDPATTLVGVVDEVYVDTRRNLLVVRDHKTHTSLDNLSVADEMMDSQLQLYAWGVSPLVSHLGHGQIKAVAYDRARSAAPKQPVLTKSGSLSKSVTDYDARTYLDWVGDGVPYDGIKKDGSGAGVYHSDPKVVEQLGSLAVTSRWNRRHLTALSLPLVTSHLRAASRSATFMADTAAEVEAVSEAPRNLGRGCKWCDYAPLCRAQLIGGPDGEYDPADYGLAPK